MITYEENTLNYQPFEERVYIEIEDEWELPYKEIHLYSNSTELLTLNNLVIHKPTRRSIAAF